MKSLKPKLAWTKQLVLDNKTTFIESNIGFLKGQSYKVKRFAEKGLASLANAEISAKAINEVVEQYNPKFSSPSSSSSSPTTPTANDVSDDVFTRQLGRIYVAASPNSSTEYSSPDKIGQIRYEKWRNRLTEVSTEIQSLGLRLEQAYPYLYDNLAHQLKMPLRSSIAIEKAMTAIGDYIFKNSVITWYRIVGLFAVAGAVALECVDNFKGPLIPSIVSVFSQIIERHVARWICGEGGWIALLSEYKPGTRKYLRLVRYLGVFVGFLSVMWLPFRFYS
ncbi:hypothetical protein HELRODRAFT_188428 [Helobdella robusta]|uniref:Bcl-2 Bcl-2 homology region 1-3 domain-containing protein n=1 Tax=Helobdella robusta TaxID=6412 RepID=T1FPZ3_HELRO|nr:hypothetical protein HELRODRAFT_188428 [Helobdella robusta]ESO06646.1 hypothetical protein HELRODRAFT_188428 [Helobdella robusta]